jgi:hypothetical protein
MKKYKLKKPVKIENDGKTTTITNVTIKELKTKHLKLIPAELYNGTDLSPHKYIPVIAELTGLTEADIEEVNVVDYMSLVEIVSGLMMGESEESLETTTS